MTRTPDHMTPDIWLAQFLDSHEARRGGVVKRQIRDVERIAGRDMFLRELERRGFQAVRNGRHYVVFCNSLGQAACKRLGTRFRNRVERPLQTPFSCPRPGIALGHAQASKGRI